MAQYGGVFHAFDGLLKTYGEKRVIDTPISEMGFIGMGVGAAARGLRPVCDLMFFDFIGVCLDQLYNQAAKLKFMFGGDVSVPLTLTTAGGAGLSAGPAAQPEPGGVARARAGPEGGAALVAARREGADGGRRPR